MRPVQRLGRKHAIATAAVGIGAAALLAYHGSQVQAPPVQRHATVRVGSADLYPNPQLTPGTVNPDITQANIDQTICNPHWSTKSIRPPASYTSKLKLQQLNSGYNHNGDLNPKNYEEDHFISLELGGAPSDPKNLWPEFGASPNPKDKVENFLHKQICSGTMTLSEAQHAITSDWYAILINNHL